MYDLGVRAFAVFFDDISGEGTNPERQAALLNYIDEYFVKKKGDVIPLLMCPTDYAKAWAQNGSYIGRIHISQESSLEQKSCNHSSIMFSLPS